MDLSCHRFFLFKCDIITTNLTLNVTITNTLSILYIYLFYNI